MTKLTAATAFLPAVLAASILTGQAFSAEGGADRQDQPSSVLRKPIPDRLVVLTFDDGCASGYKVVAPILKSMGFGGSFYVCDFDSFKTRKDWYMTWRQMKALDEDGLEIGNHTVGHGGGLDNFLKMEDELRANNVPKPTTVCWPLYQVNWNICPDLTANGYLFGRGGHERPYRPAVDNPFDVPSFTISDRVSVEMFARMAQQACQGRIVVFTFHGVPDMEHPAVGLAPVTFKAMMQYLKDNQYKAIAMRDLAEYVDPAKAAKLPPTAGNVKDSGLSMSLKDDKPYVAVAAPGIQGFRFPGLPSVSISKADISVTVPYDTKLSAMAPEIKVSAGAAVVPASGVSRDFTRPQPYTVTGADGSSKTYTVTVNRAAVSRAKDMLTFVLPGKASIVVSGNRVGVYVPPTTDVTALAPTFTLSPYATAVPASGAVRDFTRPQIYTIAAQDGSTQICIVTVVKSGTANEFVWSEAAGGDWSDVSNWADSRGGGSAPAAVGRADYVLDFKRPGTYAVNNDLNAGFLLNRLNLTPAQGQGITLTGKAIALTDNKYTGTLASIHENTLFGRDRIAAPIELRSDVAVNLVVAGQLVIEGLISGQGGLVCNGGNGNASSDLNGGPNQHYSRLFINNPRNTYSGGTVISGGSLVVAANSALGTGPVTLNHEAGFVPGPNDAANSLILNGGTIDAGAVQWKAPVTLNANTRIAGHNLNFNGPMTGPGGFTQVGTWGPWGRTNSGRVCLWGVNTYTGSTTVRQGTLLIKRSASLYNAETAQWTPEKITIQPAATLVVSAGGPGEFTGEQVGTLLKNLADGVNDNGLMAGAVLCLDTTNAAGAVTVSVDIADSKGPGGGPFTFKKCGPGTLQLSGRNTYTGRTVLEGGALRVASLNSVVNGKATSSLGAPTDVEAGEIVMGSGDGEFTLIYTGPGETSDRVINLAGGNSTATFDQSGAGLLKFASTFVISGYGANKTIAIKGDTAGEGEIAGNLVDPYDRAGKATTSVVKSGGGAWTLSGANSYTGPTTVTGGTLCLASPRSLGQKSEVRIVRGAKLRLAFEGQVIARGLYLDGNAQPDGRYDAANRPEFIQGPGALSVQSAKHTAN